MKLIKLTLSRLKNGLVFTLLFVLELVGLILLCVAAIPTLIFGGIVILVGLLGPYLDGPTPFTKLFRTIDNLWLTFKIAKGKVK